MDGGEPGVHGPRTDEREQGLEVDHSATESTEERVKYLAAQVEALQETLARLHGPHNIASGTLPAGGNRRSGRTAAAIILSIGVVICGALLASSLAWRLSSSGTGTPIVVSPVQPGTSDGVGRVRAAAAAPIATPAPVSQAVSVCTARHFNRAVVSCSQDDLIMDTAAFNGARLAYTGPGGGTFAHNTVLILLSEQNRNGSWNSLGSVTDTVPVGFTNRSVTLAGIFAGTVFAPSFDGSTYRIEVDSGDASLGAETFTLAGPDAAATAQRIVELLHTADPRPALTPASTPR